MAASNTPENMWAFIHKHWEAFKKKPRDYAYSLLLITVVGAGYFYFSNKGDSKPEPTKSVQNYGNNSNVAGRDVNQTVQYSVTNGPPNLVYRQRLGPVQDIRTKAYVIAFDLANAGGGLAIVDEFIAEVIDILETSAGEQITGLVPEYDLKVELPKGIGLVSLKNAKRHQLQSGNADGFRMSLTPQRFGCVYFVRLRFKWADVTTGKTIATYSPIYALRFPSTTPPTKEMDQKIEEQESRIDRRMKELKVTTD